MVQPDLARSALQVGDEDFVNSGLLGQVDLPPAALLAKLADAFSKLDADIRGHSSSIDLADALYLVDALSGVVFLAQEPGSLPGRAGSVMPPSLKSCESPEISYSSISGYVLLRPIEAGNRMIDCKELIGKVVRQARIFENGDYGPEVNFEFTDGSNFNVCLRNTVDAKLTLDEGGQPSVLRDYCSCGDMD